MDMGAVFDEIFEAARDFQDEFSRNFGAYGNFGRNPHWNHEENVDYYPNYSYPPMNVYMTGDRSMVFEFALAGFEERNISLSFQGDYMVFSAKICEEPQMRAVNDEGEDECRNSENIRYFKRRLKFKDIERQKYFVPHDKYEQEKVKAVFKNGVLKVTVPPKNEPDANEGIKIEIVKEGA
jgi:HSP20 family molecular chaperone IbpA